MKIEFKYDKLESRYVGEYLFFREQREDLYCIINKDEELLGHLEKLRVGAWMSWCLTLEEGCYLSASCQDEVRFMTKKLNAIQGRDENKC